VLALASCGAPPPGDGEIVELSAVDLAAQIAAGHISAERATQVFLDRIAALDDAGPGLNAIIEVNPDALTIARSLDERFRSGGVVGPLHGVPVVVKANIDTADRLATSAGSLALANHHAKTDADVVAKLRASGAVILGKTNLSEWANFRSPRSTSGWSALGGQTRNPYVLDRNPCGSSSGSAVAVAARLAPLAVGTETDGSIVCPAGVNGVVGIKPTHGLVGGRGIVPIAPSQDTAGPLARTARDAALLLAAIAGDAPDSESAVSGGPGLAGARLGVFRGYGGDRQVDVAFADALASLRAAGAELADPIELPFAGVREAELELLLYEFREHLGRYLAEVEHGPRSVDELIEFNDAHAADELAYFGQEWLFAAREHGGLDEPGYVAARERAARFRDDLARVFADQRLDAIVAPTNSRAWRTDLGNGDRFGVDSATIAAVSGNPSVAVPMRLSGELPLGLAFIGKPRDEATLVAFAAAFEAARGPFPEPRFLATVGD
jgi:amidase